MWSLSLSLSLTTPQGSAGGVLTFSFSASRATRPGHTSCSNAAAFERMSAASSLDGKPDMVSTTLCARRYSCLLFTSARACALLRFKKARARCFFVKPFRPSLDKAGLCLEQCRSASASHFCLEHFVARHSERTACHKRPGTSFPCSQHHLRVFGGSARPRAESPILKQLQTEPPTGAISP